VSADRPTAWIEATQTLYTEATDSKLQPLPGPAGACPECSSPLRHDQRYCLQCGAPVQEPPADSAETIGFASVSMQVASPPVSPPPHLIAGESRPAGDEPGGSASTVLAAVGVLLLAIGVGVLIGRAGAGGNESNASTPQVITLSAPTTSTTSTETASTNSTSSGSHSKHHAKSSRSNEVGSSDAHPAPPSVVKKLEEKGGGSYEQKSNNLPNVISTG
jgi:hypothetical protein